jgi:hypothetical protein
MAAAATQIRRFINSSPAHDVRVTIRFFLARILGRES